MTLVLLVVYACAPPHQVAQPTTSVASRPAPTTRPTPTALPTPSAPSFTGTVTTLSASQRRSITGASWTPGCPVPLDDLRDLTVSHYTDDGTIRVGDLIVHADAARAMLTVFRKLFALRYPIHSLRPVDTYRGDDEASMTANNTSAFNCRPVEGSSSWSQHAYGRAIDLNPFKNPSVENGTVDPPTATQYADRSRRDPEMIRHGDPVWAAFASVGWRWGGDWHSPKDYQHFSANGR